MQKVCQEKKSISLLGWGDEEEDVDEMTFGRRRSIFALAASKVDDGLHCQWDRRKPARKSRRKSRRRSNICWHCKVDVCYVHPSKVIRGNDRLVPINAWPLAPITIRSGRRHLGILVSLQRNNKRVDSLFEVEGEKGKIDDQMIVAVGPVVTHDDAAMISFA